MARPFVGDQRYRTIDEERIVQLLLVTGWRFAVRAGRHDTASAEARAGLERLVQLGLPFRIAAAGRLFDPVEVANFVVWSHFHHGERLWEDFFVATARREIWEPFPRSGDCNTPPCWDALGPRRYDVSIRRTFNLRGNHCSNLVGRRPGRRVRLRLPAPIVASGLDDLKIEFVPPHGVVAAAVHSPGRLDVSLDIPEDGEVSIGLKASFTAAPYGGNRNAETPAASLMPEERELYTRPNEGLVKTSALVGRLAAELAGDDGDHSRIVRRFWDFIFGELTCGAIHYDALDPARPLDWVVEHGWYDCRVGSALMVALCRARQIPARLVTGYTLHPAAPGFHTWLEVWLDDRGWIPLDFECWVLSVAGRDADWRDFFFGRLDHRMVVELPPRLFGGLGDIRLPARWHMLLAQTDLGSALTFENVDTGSLVYRDDIAVERLE